MAGTILNIRDFPTRHIVGNKSFEGHGPTLSLSNPKDGSSIVSLNGVSTEDVDQAVGEAQKAMNGDWATYSGAQRALCLNKFADLLDEYAEAIGYFESICSGRPLGQVVAEIPRVSAVYRYYAGWADKIKGDAYVADDGFYKIVRHEPLGVCAGITAWNGSLHFLSWKSAPALACGNVVLIKPSEKSPLGTMAASYLIQAAGFPPGVFQILAGGGEIGAHLSSHMDIQKISFTGSGVTGRKIQEAATRSNLKRVTLELGGKSPGIVFDDANLDTALFWCVLSITANSGQVCAATSRLLLQESIAEEFLKRIKSQFEAIATTLGADPQDKSTTYGPLVDKLQYEKVQRYIRSGQNTSQLITGGIEDEKSTAGYYVAPTIFLNPKDDDPIYREEVFGPVLCVKTFKTEEEAITMGNDTEYGLAGSVYTETTKRALRVPMGGFGSSGIGRELGEYALRHYTEPKSIWIK
ncbi:aldehyde dehydrogenase [Grosmannia clavigera kw1407]|uniref:aldehyde dehydrogenase (NAD(+)) n=1 Tax=Grosmannia clavigera (strain kw1407 / UAMH 11150) TaxID=655863 RepID=F0XNL4_GROCL|nr:aldehyde dehydrogenase [Grosmannia clavigera kw1407]EFX00112.1 aldehyde dehydrogenase [Grosmannia clavigera kw1407]